MILLAGGQGLIKAVIKFLPIYYSYPNEQIHFRQKCGMSGKMACVFSESCMGRCENGFDSARTCQCDSMCKYYKSCCSDYEAICAMMSESKNKASTHCMPQVGAVSQQIHVLTKPFLIPPSSSPGRHLRLSRGRLRR